MKALKCNICHRELRFRGSQRKEVEGEWLNIYGSSIVTCIMTSSIILGIPIILSHIIRIIIDCIIRYTRDLVACS